jgi:hypothetical protein
MRAHLLREVHLDPDTSDANSQVSNDCDIAIINAIRFNRRYRFAFNEAWYTLQTQNNVDRYALPADYIGLVQDSVFLVPAYEFLSKTKLKSVPIQFANQVQQSSVASVAYREIGSPNAYAIDPSSKVMIVLPIPSDSSDTIEFLYVKDVGTPVMKYTGSAWAFYSPAESGVMSTASETLPTTYTNAWFQEAYDLTFCRAAYILLSRTYGGTQGAAERANQYITQWAEHLNALRSEARLARSSNEIRKHI